ncbi:MAG: hypothetical protein K2U26_07775 [Cyclobacteriaceae bacterium]|nr:hypothetical protein [Cyclobacteriaceae bacterium]
MKSKNVKSLWLVALVGFVIYSCEYKELPTSFDCGRSTLALALANKTNATSCKAIDGTLSVTSSGGTAPYDYKIADGIYQTNPAFDKLAPGLYEITTKDAKGCTATLEVDIVANNSTLSAAVSTSADSQCLTDNGAIMIAPSGGEEPYQVKLGNTTFGTSTSFTNLKHGTYVLYIKDSNDCQRTVNATVERGRTSISYANDISPIVTTNCTLSGCHDAGTGSRDYTNFSNVKSAALSIKTRTGNRTMPLGRVLTQNQIDLIACWVDDGAINN